MLLQKCDVLRSGTAGAHTRAKQCVRTTNGSSNSSFKLAYGQVFTVIYQTCIAIIPVVEVL